MYCPFLKYLIWCFFCNLLLLNIHNDLSWISVKNRDSIQIYFFLLFFFIFFLNLIHLYVKLSGIVLHGIQSKQKRTILSRFFTEMHDKSLCIFNNSKLQIKHQIRYFKNGLYINTISTDKAKLAKPGKYRSFLLRLYSV
jgi:hypothetical protein